VMTGRGSFTTNIAWADSRGDEIDADVRVLYSRYAGYKGDYYQPPEDASVEIIEITPADRSLTAPDYFFTDDDLIAECMAAWDEEIADAEEWHAQARRDRMMEDF